MKLTGKTRHLCNRDIMITNITQLAEIAFQGEDPEIEWIFFRNELKKIKKEYSNSYEEYMESEDDTEYPETDWQNFKRERPSYTE